MSDISLEELLKTIEEAEESVEELELPKHKDVVHMTTFLTDSEIKVGIDRIPNYVIYYTYRILWRKVDPHALTSKIKFFRTFNKQFTQVRTGKQRSYLLDAGAFDLTREGILEAKHYDEKYNKRIKEKANKKKQDRISKSKKEHESKS